MKSGNLFMGLDPGQTNQGLALIDDELNIVDLVDSGINIPPEYKGKGLPDIVRNSYVYQVTDRFVQQVNGNIKMCVMEGANYSSKYNVTPISIGSIHGQNQIYFWTNQIDFAIVPPRSIQVGIHGTSVDITKAKTKERMREIFGEQIPKRGFSSNMSDALGMAYLARQLYHLMSGTCELTTGEQKLFISQSKTKGRRRGLVYNIGTRLFIFDGDGHFHKPFEGETLNQFYYRVKNGGKS